MASRLPLHDLHAAAGAPFETVDGWELPLAYGDRGVREPAHGEYWSVRDAAGIVDRSHLGVVEVGGRDRASFLHALLSNEVKALAPGQGCAATLLDVHGKVQVLLSVWVLEDRILVVTPPGRAADALERLDHYLFAEKVTLTDVSGSLALLLLAGPRAPEIAERLAGSRPPADAWAHVAGKFGETPIRVVSGGGETGTPEAWLVGPAALGEPLWASAVSAGAVPVGHAAFEALRIEAGTPRFPDDVGPTVLLPEIPLERLVSQTKGCYPGQEVVVRIRDRGHVNRHLRGLVLQDTTVPPAGSEVVAGDTVIGTVTSAAYSFGLDRPIALAMIRRQHAEPGTAVGVRIGQASPPAVGPLAGPAILPATVSALPFRR